MRFLVPLTVLSFILSLILVASPSHSTEAPTGFDNKSNGLTDLCHRSGYRAPSTLIFEAALSISRRSSGVSSTAAAPMFSSRRLGVVGPGIGTIHGF